MDILYVYLCCNSVFDPRIDKVMIKKTADFFVLNRSKFRVLMPVVEIRPKMI